MSRFLIVTAATPEALVSALNAQQTLFSTLVYFGKGSGKTFIAVLDFNFSPVITYSEIDEARERMAAHSEHFKLTLSA